MHIRTALEQRGHRVLLAKEHDVQSQSQRRQLAERLRRDLEQVDVLLVLNNEYEGVKHALSAAMLLEVGVAFYLSKQVYLFGDYPVGALGEELRKYEAIALQGDISRF